MPDEENAFDPFDQLAELAESERLEDEAAERVYIEERDREFHYEATWSKTFKLLSHCAPAGTTPDEFYVNGVKLLKELSRLLIETDRLDHVKGINALAQAKLNSGEDPVDSLQRIVVTDLIIGAETESDSVILEKLQKSAGGANAGRGLLRVACNVKSYITKRELRAGSEPVTEKVDDPNQTDEELVDTLASNELAKIGIADRPQLTFAQKRNLIWLGWRETMGVAQIRDEWNRRFPKFAIASNKDNGSPHVRSGIGLAKKMIKSLKD